MAERDFYDEQQKRVRDVVGALVGVDGKTASKGEIIGLITELNQTLWNAALELANAGVVPERWASGCLSATVERAKLCLEENGGDGLDVPLKDKKRGLKE